MKKDYKIAIAGTGYVGLSIATLLSQHHQVTAVDIIPEKVDMINNRKSPIQDDYIEKYLAEKELNLTATLDAKAAYADADLVVIAAPTNVYPKFSVDFSWSMMTVKIIRNWRKIRLSGTGLGKVISTFSNEMERTFSRAMGWMRTILSVRDLFLSEMDEAKNMDFFVSGRGLGIVISTF